MYEGWLSRQQPTAQGLKLAEAEHRVSSEARRALEPIEREGAFRVWAARRHAGAALNGPATWNALTLSIPTCTVWPCRAA